MKKHNIMIRPIVELFCFIQRWRESKDFDEIPDAFHNAFNRTLEQIQEHEEEIQQQWKEVCHSKEESGYQGGFFYSPRRYCLFHSPRLWRGLNG